VPGCSGSRKDQPGYRIAPVSYYVPVRWQTGSQFLYDLNRRAFADGRLHLVETTAIAALAGGLSGIKLDEWGTLTVGSPAEGVTWAVVAAASWIMVGSILYYFARQGQRAYIGSVLVQTGLLYLVLEHDPHDALKPLRQRETWLRLRSKPGADLSFRQRMLAFLRVYPKCASILGFEAYPQLWRNFEWSLGAVLVGFIVFYLFLVGQGVLQALSHELEFPLHLKAACWLVLALLLLRAMLALARKTGLWLALVDVLIGEVDRRQATLAR